MNLRRADVPAVWAADPALAAIELEAVLRGTVKAVDRDVVEAAVAGRFVVHG